MKLSTFVITFVTVIGYANAHSDKLMRRSTSAPFLVAYSDGTEESFNFQECIPVPEKNSSAVVVWITFLQSATCYLYQSSDCSGSITPPVGVLYPAGVFIPNPGDIGQLVTQAGKCYSIALPELPIRPAAI